MLSLTQPSSPAASCSPHHHIFKFSGPPPHALSSGEILAAVSPAPVSFRNSRREIEGRLCMLMFSSLHTGVSLVIAMLCSRQSFVPDGGSNGRIRSPSFLPAQPWLTGKDLMDDGLHVGFGQLRLGLDRPLLHPGNHLADLSFAGRQPVLLQGHDDRRGAPQFAG